jgi:hypothetical protein
LTATIASTGGTPTGQIAFLDGNTNLGSATLNAGGVATLAVDTLSAGTHSLTATYAGDGAFAATLPPVTMVIAAQVSPWQIHQRDVTAGQSVILTLRLHRGWIRRSVTFPAEISGIACRFGTSGGMPNGRAATSMLTVTTSAGGTHYCQTLNFTDFGLLLGSLGVILALSSFGKKFYATRTTVFRAAAGALAVFVLALTLISCGGYTTSGAANRGTASIVVTAQSGAVSHATTIRVTVQ